MRDIIKEPESLEVIELNGKYFVTLEEFKKATKQLKEYIKDITEKKLKQALTKEIQEQILECWKMPEYNNPRDRIAELNITIQRSKLGDSK